MKLLLKVKNHPIDIQAIEEIYIQLSELKEVFKVKKAEINQNLSVELNGKISPQEIANTGLLPVWGIEIEIELTNLGKQLDNLQSNLIARLNDMHGITVISIDDKPVSNTLNNERKIENIENVIPNNNNSSQNSLNEEYGFISMISFSICYDSFKTQSVDEFTHIANLLRNALGYPQIERESIFKHDVAGNMNEAHVTVKVKTPHDITIKRDQNIATIANILNDILMNHSKAPYGHLFKVIGDIKITSAPATQEYKVDDRIESVSTEYSYGMVTKIVQKNLNSAGRDFAKQPYQTKFEHNRLGHETLRTYVYQEIKPKLTISATLFNQLNNLTVEDKWILELQESARNLVQRFPDFEPFQMAINGKKYNEALRIACRNENLVLFKLLYKFHDKKYFRLDFADPGTDGKSALELAKATGNDDFYKFVKWGAEATIKMQIRKI